jgi:probable addiction module antidote protein
MKVTTNIFDEADYLESDEDIAAYLTEALATDEGALITHALGVVARVRGTSRLASELGMAPESLQRALTLDGGPEFTTVLRIIHAMGLRLTAEPASKAA